MKRLDPRNLLVIWPLFKLFVINKLF